MCGIAGMIGPRTVVERSRLTAMAAAFAHRGPDDEGIEVIAHDEPSVVGFAHRRLSIIDLSPNGHQPMQDPETGNWIVFNGEIYNYRAVRKELQERGHQFRSESDTEVILKAYAEYGTACVERLRGMFAFGLWDAAVHKLFLAVDRFGIKPLYYWRDTNTFLFASELRALLATKCVPKVIDRGALDSFLAFGAVQAPSTMIQGVRTLLPAQMMVFDPERGAGEAARYWTPPRDTAATDVGAALEDAVRCHLVSDVPVGLFLSGGIDSSALAALAHRVCGGKELESFSVGFPEAEFSESSIARLVGEQFCKKHHELQVSDADVAALLPGALEAQDQPTIDGVNAYVISKAVREAGIKVVLSGQGGDEVFGGYPTFRRLPTMVRLSRLMRRVPARLRINLARLLGEGSIARSKLAQYSLLDDDPVQLYALSRQLFGRVQRQRFLGGEASAWGIPDAVSAEIGEECAGRPLFDQVSLLELRGYLANMLLRDGDVMSMAHGLEVRVPYLDHLLVETVFRTPTEQKVRRGVAKPLLLGSLRDALPPAVYRRAKMGFTFPWELWLRNRLRDDVEETMAGVAGAAGLGLDQAACQELWKRFLGHDPGVSWSRVWALFVLIRWVDRNL